MLSCFNYVTWNAGVLRNPMHDFFNVLFKAVATFMSSAMLLITGAFNPYAQATPEPASVIVAVAPTTQQEPVSVASSERPPAFQPAPRNDPAPTSNIVSQSPAVSIYPTTIVEGVSQTYVDNQIQILRNSLSSEIFKYSSAQFPNAPGISQYTANLAVSQRIDQLANVTITNATVRGLSGLTAADIPSDISLSNYLALTGGTLSGDLSVAGNTTLANATSSAFAVSTLAVGSLIKAGSGGALVSAIAGTDFLTATRAINTTYPLVGGGDLSADRTLTLAFGTTTQNFWGAFNSFSSLFSSSASTTNATTTNLHITSIAGSGLAVDSVGRVYGAATTTAGTGLSYNGGAFHVNTTQNIARFSNLTSNGILKTSGGDGTLSIDTSTYATFSYPFPLSATSSLVAFSGGLTSFASSTLGNGTEAGGLTIFGGATTTGNAYFTSNVGIGTTTPTSKFSIQGVTGLSAFAVASSTGASMLTVNADGSLDAKLKQLTADYLVDAGSQTIAVGDVVSYINGKAEKARQKVNPGTPVTANAVNSPYISTAILDSTKFVVVYINSNTGFVEAVIGTVSGTAVTYGTPVALNATGSAYVSAATLDSGKFVVAYQSSNIALAVVSTVSGTTITPGTPVALNATAIYETSVAALDSGKFVVAYRHQSDNSANAVVSTVSGTTITAGTPAALNASVSVYLAALVLDSGKFVVAYRNQSNSNYAYAVVSTVSGTTITAGTPTALNAVSSDYTSAATLDSGKFVVAYQNDGTTFANALVATVSGTTITAGTPVVLNAVNTLSTSIAALDSGKFVVAYYGASNYANAVVSTVSGTTITAGTPTAVNAVSSSYISAATLDSGKFVVAYRADSNNYANAVVTIADDIFNSSKILGMATNATSTTNNMITVASNGIVSGLSGLTAGSTYYWSLTTGVTTTSQSYKVGIAISSTSMLLNSGNGGASAGTDQFFGDMIFANNFRFTEGWDYPQSLIFKNQLSREIMRIDENGDMAIQGALSAKSFRLDGLSSLLSAATFGFFSATTSGAELTATATSTGSGAWAGAFSSASATIRAALSDLGNAVVHVFSEPIYAAVGFFENVFAKELTFDRGTGDELTVNERLCIGSACVTEAQFLAMLASAGASTPDTIGPFISLNGANPAHIDLGATYSDLGAVVTDNIDQNLGYRVSLDGATSTDPSELVLDTVVAGTHIITYSATDQAGNEGLTTRTVIVGE